MQKQKDRPNNYANQCEGRKTKVVGQEFSEDAQESNDNSAAKDMQTQAVRVPATAGWFNDGQTRPRATKQKKHCNQELNRANAIIRQTSCAYRLLCLVLYALVFPNICLARA
jgi:hypothetical protein